MALPFLKSVATFAIFAQLLCGNVPLGQISQQESVISHVSVAFDDSGLHPMNPHPSENTCQPDGRCLRSLSGVSIPQIQNVQNVSHSPFATIAYINDVSSFPRAYSPPIHPGAVFDEYGILAHKSLVALRL